MSLKRFALAVLFACAGMGTHPLQAQCKSFTKRKCLPHLAPYMNNGQLNTATMSPGQTADMIMNFNSGQSYRIIVCGEGVLGPVEFVVKDASGNVLFTNKKQEVFTDSWDFSMEQTTQLTVTVKVPDQVDKTQFNREGCVTVLVGFKK
jgi:outer membrane biogenesis lipoprotein LolB